MVDEDKPLSDAIAVLDDQERGIIELLKHLETRLSQIRTARAALVALVSDEPTEFEGKLVDACRTVLKNEKGSLSPMEVRDKVKDLGYDLSIHPNVMAAVHGVLKRLVDSGDVKTKEWRRHPGTRYYWCGSRTSEAFDPAIYPDLKFTTPGAEPASAVYESYAHRLRSNRAAIQASTQGTYNAALHQETDKKK